MPIKSAKIDDIPPQKRKVHNIIRESDEFLMLRTKLSHGLKPGEAIQITLPSEILRKRKNAARLFKMLAVKDIKDMKLPYVVKIVGLSEVSPEIWVYDRRAKNS